MFMFFPSSPRPLSPLPLSLPAEDQDALIVAYEDSRYVVVAGTFEKLVEQLACEERPGECWLQ